MDSSPLKRVDYDSEKAIGEHKRTAGGTLALYISTHPNPHLRHEREIDAQCKRGFKKISPKNIARINKNLRNLQRRIQNIILKI